MLILIIAASLTTGILAVMQYIDSENKEARSVANEIALRKEIKTLSEDNLKLSHQLTETALQLNDNVIGNGDLEIELNTVSNTNFNFRFVNNSDLFVHNANILVQNFNDILKCQVLKQDDYRIYIKEDCYQSKHSKITGINFNPHNGYVDKETTHTFTTGYMNYMIRIATRRKTVFFQLVYKIVDSVVVRSYRIYNLIDDKMIFEQEVNNLHLPNEYWDANFYTKILYTI